MALCEGVLRKPYRFWLFLATAFLVGGVYGFVLKLVPRSEAIPWIVLSSVHVLALVVVGVGLWKKQICFKLTSELSAEEKTNMWTAGWVFLATISGVCAGCAFLS